MKQTTCIGIIIISNIKDIFINLKKKFSYISMFHIFTERSTKSLTSLIPYKPSHGEKLPSKSNSFLLLNLLTIVVTLKTCIIMVNVESFSMLS